MAISAMLARYAISALAKALNYLVRCVFGNVFSSECWAWLLATFPTLWHRWKLIVMGPEGDYERWSDLDVQHISWKDSNAARGYPMYCQNWNQTSWSVIRIGTWHTFVFNKNISVLIAMFWDNSCPGQLNRWPCQWLTQSVSESVTFWLTMKDNGDGDKTLQNFNHDIEG